MQCAVCKQQRLFLETSAGKNLRCRNCGNKEKFHAPSYDHYHAQKYSYQRMRTPANDPLLKRITTSFQDLDAHSSVLDYGCGAGDYAIHFSTITTHVTGMDRDITQAKKNSRVVHWIAHDKTKLPFRSNSFNYITCVNVIEHLYDFETTMIELKRILKPKGTLFITTYDTDFILHKYLYDPTHLYEWRRDEFTDFVEKYLNVLNAFKYGTFFNYYPFNWLITQILRPELCVVASKD